MKGLIKVNPQGLIDLTRDICIYMDDFNIDPYKKTENRFSFLSMRKIENITYYSNCPFWYQYKGALKKHLFKLKNMAENAIKNNDEIWLSELSYCHLVMLSNGDKHANPIYIMDY